MASFNDYRFKCYLFDSRPTGANIHPYIAPVGPFSPNFSTPIDQIRFTKSPIYFENDAWRTVVSKYLDKYPMTLLSPSTKAKKKRKSKFLGSGPRSSWKPVLLCGPAILAFMETIKYINHHASTI